MQSNVKILSEVKQFITEAFNNKALRSLFLTGPKAFTRNRKLGFENLVFLMLNFFKRSYSIELAEFYSHIGEDFTVSKSAFCQQRMKVNDVFFATLNAVLVDSFYRHTDSEIVRWKGFRLIAVDGSTAYLSDRTELKEAFGTQANQSRKQAIARIVTAFDVLNKITALADIVPKGISEQHVAHCWLQHYDPDMLLIYDRGFPGFVSAFLHQAREVPQPFIVRCPIAFTHEIRDFIQSSEIDIQSIFRANRHCTKQLYTHGYVVSFAATTPIRFIKVFLDNGQVEVLATNLFDKDQYPPEVFKELYGSRWGIETNYDVLKNKLQLEAFSGQKPITINQDFHIAVFLANLQQIIARPCQQKLTKQHNTRKYSYSVNKNVAFGLMKNRVVDLFRSYNPEKILTTLESLFLLHLEPKRPDRKYLRRRKSPVPKGKFSTCNNYKRAF